MQKIKVYPKVSGDSVQQVTLTDKNQTTLVSQASLNSAIKAIASKSVGNQIWNDGNNYVTPANSALESGLILTGKTPLQIISLLLNVTGKNE